MRSRTISDDPYAGLRVLASIHERCGRRVSVTLPVVYLLQELGAIDLGYVYHVSLTGASCLQAMWDIRAVNRARFPSFPFIHAFLADMEALQPWRRWMDVAARVIYRLRWRLGGVSLSRDEVYGFLCPRRFFYLDPYDFFSLWILLVKHRLIRDGSG